MKHKRHSTRREFLQGKAAADTLLDLAQGTDEPIPAAVATAPSYLVHVGRRAMACEFEIYLNAGQYAHGTEAALDALDLVDRLEDQLSVYRATSELSNVNRTAADGPVEVDPELFRLLDHALRISDETGGAYDITASPLSRVWGFFRREGKMPTNQELDDAMSRVGSRHVLLDPQRQAVEFLRDGVELSLNSIGKGYTLDRCAELLARNEVHDFLFHGGQSSVLARGSHGNAPRDGWTVGLRHPLRPEKRLAEFFLRDRALGTSGSATQFFYHQGRRFGHVLDPRTGQPAEGVYSATVLAPTAAEADALSTAFYVLGPEGSLDYCRRRSDLAMVMVCPGPRSGTIQLHTSAVEEDDWRLLAQIT